MNDVLGLLGRNAIALSLVCRYFRSAGLDVLAGCIVDLHSAHDVKEVAGLRAGEFAKQLRFVRLTAPIGQQGISELSDAFKKHFNCFPKVRELVMDDGRTPEQLLTIEQGEHAQHYVEDLGASGSGSPRPPIHPCIASVLRALVFHAAPFQLVGLKFDHLVSLSLAGLSVQVAHELFIRPGEHPNFPSFRS
ncbi:hypothetical protein T439DRAFT_352324 [Meredithblackwellia eburnea MCA 4105]